MSVEIRVPPLGESLVDAVVGQWLKQEGDEVSRGETVVLLETDKVNLDVTAEEDGVLSRIDRHEGDVVTVGDVLGLVGAEAAAPAAVPSNGASAPAAEPAPATPVAAAEAATQLADELAAAGRAAPAVRRLAEEHHIDLAGVVGSGPDGRVTREDVMLAVARQQVAAGAAVPAAPTPTPAVPAPAAAAPTPAPAAPVVATPAAAPAPVPPAPAPTAGNREEIVRFSRRRQTIANRLVEAQRTAAMLTTFNEVDMSAVMDLRSRRKDAFKEKHGVGLGFMSFFTKAAVGALKAYPEVNAELRGDALVLKKHYDIGIAVGVEEGLVVPVVRDADRLGFAEIEREIVDLAKQAREGTIALADLMGGTFTITNGGVYGSLMSTPILNAPQVGILGMHAIQPRPVARDGEVVVRPMMYLALSYDHRVVDGRTAVLFLVKIKELIEDPETLLLEG